MNKILVGGIVIIIIIGGYFWYTRVNPDSGISAIETSSDMGTYAYTCENGSQFTMTPSNDVSYVTLEAGAQGMFTGTYILHKMGDGNHYETGSGGGTLIVLSGAGEEVQLTVGSESTACDPVPSATNAPWNWGDAAEGGGVKPDTRLVVGESIMGKWQSTTDAKFTREFKNFSETGLSGSVSDWYDNEVQSSGTYVVFTKANPLTVSFPLVDNTTYLQLTMQGTQADKLNFRLVKLTPEELELVYMDRGGALTFKKVQ